MLQTLMISFHLLPPDSGGHNSPAKMSLSFGNWTKGRGNVNLAPFYRPFFKNFILKTGVRTMTYSVYSPDFYFFDCLKKISRWNLELWGTALFLFTNASTSPRFSFSVALVWCFMENNILKWNSKIVWSHLFWLHNTFNFFKKDHKTLHFEKKNSI